MRQHTTISYSLTDWSAIKTKATYPVDRGCVHRVSYFRFGSDPSDYVSYSLKYILPTFDKCFFSHPILASLLSMYVKVS